ncbi:hypothetical protein K502DRAFT_362139 [Neoconidiobolus thromboides FSU 785]|nr:hypothetical protein K502DRAFT_362139 [Neoconidiobolus thromboides FSU 785]
MFSFSKYQIVKLIKKYPTQIIFIIALSILAWYYKFKYHSSWLGLVFKPKKAILPKRSRKKKVLSISLDKIVLWNPSKDPSVPNYAFVESIVPILQKLCEQYELYLIGTVGSKKEQKQIEELIYNSELSKKHGLDVRKVIFCETTIGRSHIVRHIEPHIHVDSEMDVIRGLRMSMSRLILILSKTHDPITSLKKDPSLPKNVEIFNSFPDSAF